jgi:hypothetical protein
MGFYSLAHLDGAPVTAIGEGPGGVGRPVVYFATEDIEASAAMARDLGANVFMGPMSISDVGQMALVLDPVGAVHGLWQAGTFTGFGRRWEPGSTGWFDHVSADPAAAGAYYAALTGHELQEPSPEMRVLVANEQMFASVSFDQMPGRDPQWNVIWVADSLDRVREAVPALGGTVVLHEMPVPGSAITVVTEPVLNTMVTIMAAGSGDQ